MYIQHNSICNELSRYSVSALFLLPVSANLRAFQACRRASFPVESGLQLHQFGTGFGLEWFASSSQAAARGIEV